MIVDQLFAVLGYQIDGEDNLRRFRDGMDGALRKAQDFGRKLALAGAAAVTAFAAVGTGMFKLATDAAKPLDDLVKVADRIGVAFEDLQELGFAAEQSGASTAEMSSSLQSMGRQLAEAARDTGRARKALEDYGLKATDASGQVKDTVQFLGEVADKMATLSDQKALDLGTKLGLSPALITMLKSGNEEIENLRQQARDGGLIFTEKEARQAEAFNDQLNLFNRSITAIRHRIGVQFLPVLQQTISRMQGWINANQQLIRQNIELWTGRVVAGMEMAIQSAGRFIRAIAAIGNRIGDLFRYLSGGAIDLSMWRSLAILGGVLLRIFAPFTAFLVLGYIAIDEFLSYMEGGESVIGDFIGWIQELTGVSEPLAQALAAAAAALALMLLARPIWLLGWLARLVALAGGATAITTLSTAVRGLTTSLLALSGASVSTLGSGLIGLLTRLGVLGAVATLSGDTPDNEYRDAGPEARASMRRDARTDAATHSGDYGRSGPRNARRDHFRGERERERSLDEFLDGPPRAPAAAAPSRSSAAPVVPSPLDLSGIRDALKQLADGARSLVADAMGASPIAAHAATANAGGPGFAGMMANFQAHMAKMSAVEAGDTIMNDNSVRQDNRQFPVSVNTTVNQTVQQATQAPAAAARATGDAVGRAAVQQRTQLNQEPSF